MAIQGVDIVAELAKSPKRHSLDIAELQKLGFAPESISVLETIGAQQIAADFVVPKTERFIGYNTRVPFVPKDWLCFANSGSGDLWLMKRDAQTEIAFLDHDQESRAKAQPLGIDLRQWVELAWYMREFDRKWDRHAPEAAKRKQVREGRAFLESLSKGLSKKYPYKLG